MGRYAEYKDSGLEWIGEIPAHWTVSRIKYIVDESHIYAIGDGDHGIVKVDDYLSEGIPYIRVLNLTWGNGLKMENMVYISEEMNHKIRNSTLRPKDLLIAKTGATIGKTAIVPDNLPISNTTSHVGKITLSKSHYPKFFFHVLNSPIIKKQIDDISTMQSTRPEIGIDGLKNLIVVAPPVTEQQTIADFLDAKCAKLDSIIENYASHISMLTRYKRDLIAQCVTKGLDKSAPMKPSGEDWIGDVPEHWNITKLKWMFEIVKRIYGKEDRDVLAITQQGIKLKDMESNRGQYAESYATYQIVNVNDFAMNSMDLLTGWVDCSPYEGVTSPDYRVFRFYEDKPQCHAYFKYLFQMCYTNRIFYRLGQGVSNLGRWRLQTDQFRNIKLPQPPVEEQEQIAAYLDKKTGQIDAVAADIEAQIQKLKDYRRLLIHDAVTGKIKI